ncbi:hypothetical protein TPHA_0I01180 [Tetrapisispora phaffii CBS 4417]|uniref:Peptidase M20 dimerisation domain-containing protein n=1 Tax=Tetrapisispora phaffii (strain ATCC 24235 / CBS 4417 / NBRC 1672 / NRRL Y-8282 / UCD 70-5) TaxID=1071381 RepID=G8BXJ6_TETPH|nr:hypothetical protein TPHA_0I01180 [Tetrapisispora phaffii CBS 4417]CCE64624.1 hypothetical protein TPHA_0I01180 [Tetrapisispora phaffii CBS 4417]
MINQKRTHEMSSRDSLLPEPIHRWNHFYSILSIVSFPKKNLLVAGTQDSKILVFDLTTYNLMTTKSLGIYNNLNETNTRSSVLCMTKARDENYLFTAGSDSLVRIWSIGEAKDDQSPTINEEATVYSVSDIGDVFSIRYFDDLDTVLIGCQNASLLYLDDLLVRIKDSSSMAAKNFERLPHRRFDKFFDSVGPTGKSFVSPGHPSITHDQHTFDRTVSPIDSTGCILEIPSSHIISYAHNGFIYSIEELDLPHMANKVHGEYTYTAHMVTGGGDCLSKVWSMSKTANGVIVTLTSETMDNEESVISQAFEYPFLYCGLSDGLIKIWDISTKQLVSTLKAEGDTDIISIAVYNDHIYAFNESGISHFHENKRQTWSSNQGKVLCSEIFQRVNFPPNNFVSLLTGGNDGSLVLSNLCNDIDNKSKLVKQINIGQGRARKDSFAFYKPAVLSNELMLDTLRELISFNTVSENADTSQQLSSRRCATFIKQLLADFGAINSQLLPIKNGSNPVVFAEFEGNAPRKDRKKILWYGHYDVVPAGDTSLWNTDPFVLTCENGYMKGRGVTDNKGPLIAAIYSTASLFQEQKLQNDVVFLIEGNEEIGSPGLKDACIEHLKLIGPKIDWIFLSNSSWVDETHPCLNYGLRGVINAEITLWHDGPNKHSGVDGGVFSEPTTELIRMLSKLQNNDGFINIPGFYDNISELSEEERERFEKVLMVSNLHKNLNLDELVANWTKPSLSITSIDISGSGNITVISKSVSVGLSIRLVPGQDVEQVKANLIHFLQNLYKESNSKNHINIKIVNVADVWLGDPKNHAYQILKHEVTKAWNIEPLFVREGGSIPCIRFLEQIFEAPAVQIPCGQSTDNAHLDNESLRIINWSKMSKILTNVLNKL